jgi:DNA-binding Xre family transcriptional regulator
MVSSLKRQGVNKMAVTVNLAQFKREKEAEWGRDITWQEMMDGAGISRNTLARLLSGKAQRVDNDTANGLCKFFDIPPGPVPFIVYVPDNEG